MTITDRTSTSTSRAPVVPLAPTALRPLGIDQVRLDDGFWGRRQVLNAAATIPHCLHWEGEAGWIANFDAVLEGTIAATRTGRQFADSDVYKLLEAMAWEIGRSADASLQHRFDEIVATIERVQGEDGYLSTCFGNPGQADRYTDFEWGHELYNAGHLIQAAVARLRTGFGRDDDLVRIALRAADHVCETFGTDGLQRVGGHPEIEVALVELYRATGEQRYLDQARVFLERRGHHTLADIEFGRAYFQDDVPVREAEVLRGHAVRALYLAAGGIDAALESGDDQLLAAVTAQYRRALARRTYITGGMGSHHQDEAFGADYELPADRAYCETCAGIGSIMVAWRLLLITGDLTYGDVIERTLYNVLATSVAEDGRAFFYTNTLHQRTAGHAASADRISPRALDIGRAAWFEVSCCPTNVARTLAQFGTYVATTSSDGVTLVQYASGDISATLGDGRDVRLRVTTDYPHEGRVRIEVLDAPTDAWELTIRIPGWADGATVDLGDGRGPRSAPAPAFTHSGVLRPGTVVQLDLPLTPRWAHPDPRVDAVRGCVAVERGPLVLCAESLDQVGAADVSRLVVDSSAPIRPMNGSGAVASGGLLDVGHAPLLYGPEPHVPTIEAAPIRLVPYHSWGNRGPSTMRVWLPAIGDLP
ncbi:glycoside hydrolase family 127 protein [Ruania alkalisoli]|uniref:Glycoside hydrolase family 127 protein n=1 Tax=Ruania alkalisoli TaxID=2779775 RepID=A0A7M1SW37_9MICO|nr:beta-L-arabinofuranosidase domain-containing protein [Ruania alkalisoli]QOR71277.1 glycoside hydrolase family 127 protein [Ruania alkalisoli]